MNAPRLPVPLFLSALLALHAFGAAESAEITCHKSWLQAAPLDSPDYRKYAPDRKVDTLHLAVDVTPDFKQRTIAAKATLTFKPIAKPLDELRLDAVDLAIESVTATENIQAYQATDKNVILTFAPPVPVDRETKVTITYRCQPDQGIYFRTPELGYKPEDAHLFTQGEDVLVRHWIPCHDAPNEKFTSEITCRVPEGMTVLANGRLVSEEKDAATGLVAVRWLQDKPHVAYLISLVAGYFKKVEDRYNDLPLAFYTPTSQINEAMNSFRDTKDMMGFFEREIGVPYPWAKYYQVCVQDFVAGGMENTSITTLTDGTLFPTETENIRSSQGLVAHELAHQWFGDLVTCKDWSHAWLNEGFATYYDALYDGYKNGRDSMLYQMYHNARGFIDRRAEDDSRATVTRKYDKPGDLFGYLIYPKGAWILHMLRAQLGEDLYRRCIRTYLERHQFGTVETEHLVAVVEELSGCSWDQFFDQWAYHAHHPELEASYSWDEKTKLAKLTVKQTQKVSDDIVLFNFPLKVRFKGKAGNVDRQVTVKEKEEDFYFPLDVAPESVRLDPDYELLAKIAFNVPNAMLFAQLADTGDVMGRIFALEQLSQRKDHETVEKLKHTLNNDPFYGVRIEAARALRAVHTDEALEALLASRQQTDARVRNEVSAALGGFYTDSAYEAARTTLAQEKNPDIVAHALRALGGFGKAEVRESLVQFLNSQSFRQVLADAAINAIRAQDDPAYVTPLREVLAKRETEFTSWGFGQGLETLAYLARKEEKRDDVREFLTGYVNHKRDRIRRAAMNALGTLRDPKAIAVLQKFATAVKDSPDRSAAERAIADLRAADKPADDFKNLRGEVLDLQKQNRELRKELDDLKKRFDALQPKPADTKARKKPSDSRAPRRSSP
ncbi:MAG: HEAT repeat domain-containing protein [Verrucomicrobia bacterium]|nr:HEAT repeat domain-containing protein [Verrucomicrobiota bacterium]